jgi:hypothetical protein
MRVFVFTGPTLPAEAAGAVLDAVYLPPAGQGDVYRAAIEKPQAIGIIDGYFERVPSVWHKEVLWALAHGIPVYGSASMGALRAAELEAFGMRGVGRVFESYRDGSLEDDDEVAVVHGPAESGFRPLTEAMVNIRPTLARAEEQGVLGADSRRALEGAAKKLFYADRSYPRLLQEGAALGLPTSELTGFREWLPEGQINQKQMDALEMLHVMGEALGEEKQPLPPRFNFASTRLWEAARREAGETRLGPDGEAVTLLLDTVLEELRLDGGHAAFIQGALLRLLSLDEAQRRRLAVDQARLQATVVAFRRERGLLKVDDMESWMRENDLTPPRFQSLMEEEALVRWVHGIVQARGLGHVLDQLRLTGDYPKVVQRALDKQRWLEENGLSQPELENLGIDEDTLLRWYFEERLQRAIPRDLETYGRLMDFAAPQALRRALLREWSYATKAKASR